eukprot:TRINITY_DN189_c0_g1_i10.p1 TRINITY_DN189_c0_g1~~TRINITY_DN189_c0_g1_i10.p1  ORF type:complete len:202 (+),score=12.87 TRINITY_DN189_c0_g1_i10:2015-2620(+)
MKYHLPLLLLRFTTDPDSQGSALVLRVGVLQHTVHSCWRLCLPCVTLATWMHCSNGSRLCSKPAHGLMQGDPGLCRDDELSNGIAAVGASCRSLQRLELMVLDSSGAITDSVLRAMATLPNLHHLKIVKGTRMPYHGLFAPSRPVPPATSERGVLGLVHAANMTALETLTITGVRGATPAAAEAARANCSQLRQLNMHAWL